MKGIGLLMWKLMMDSTSKILVGKRGHVRNQHEWSSICDVPGSLSVYREEIYGSYTRFD